MADLEDLGYKSILDMSNDEAIETLRQIRLSRRVPNKKSTTKSTIKQSQTKIKAAINPNDAAELLKLLEGTE